MELHTRGNWSSRDDRRITLVWLLIFLFFIVTGFVMDLKNYFHETPAVSKIVHVHAIVTTIWLLLLITQVLLVELDNVKLHRKLGWFVAGWAALLTVLAIAAELTWETAHMNMPEWSTSFIAISIGSMLLFALLTVWGILLRSNIAAHRRVMMLANIAITMPGFARLCQYLVPFPSSFIGQFFFHYSGTLLILLLMFLWDLWKNRVMHQFLAGVFLIIGYEIVSIQLFRSAAWTDITHQLLGAWAKLGL